MWLLSQFYISQFRTFLWYKLRIMRYKLPILRRKLLLWVYNFLFWEEKKKIQIVSCNYLLFIYFYSLVDTIFHIVRFSQFRLFFSELLVYTSQFWLFHQNCKKNVRIVRYILRFDIWKNKQTKNYFVRWVKRSELLFLFFIPWWK